MRNLLTILLLFFASNLFAQTPTANAGADITIYLNQTNSVTLNGTGSTNVSSSTWREVSSDQLSGATITTPNNSLTTTVTGLPQGTFYFELDVASASDIHAVDTVKVDVNYKTLPSTATLLRDIAPKFPEMVPVVNDRTDTTNFIAGTESHCDFPDNPTGEVFYDRARSNDLFIDPQLGKFYSTVEDGYQWNNDGYSRSEMSFGDFYNIDSNKIYVFQWKGYFPQDMVAAAASYNKRGALIMQIHGGPSADSISDGPMIELLFLHDSLGVQENFNHPTSNGGNGNPVIPQEMFVKGLFPINYLFDNAHTVQLIVREGKGYVGQKAFIEFKLDGQVIYYRNNGNVFQGTGGDDYIKFATFYDYDNNFSDPTNFTRHKKASVVTEDFTTYIEPDTASVAAPTISMSGAQSISTNSTSITGVATAASGHTISSYLWTKTAGSGTIVSPTSSTTTVSSLGSGTNTFQLTATDDTGQTVTGTVTVVVNTPIVAPTANAGTDKTITLPTTSVLLSGSATHDSRTTVTYLWTKVSGSGTQTIANNTTLSPTISGLTTAGSYVFNLKVSQSDGQTANDQVTIIVNAGAAPTIYAGNNQTIPGTSTTTTLTATYTIASGYTGIFSWAQESGPTTATINTPSGSTTTIGNLAPGQYRFGCTLIQSDGQTAYDYVLVYVTAHPTANAGTDKTIALPTISVSLSGSATNDPSTTATYLWTKISGSGTQSIAGSTTLTPTISGLTTVGSYVFNLKVTQSDGQVANDQMTITVTMAGAPTVTVGSNQTITTSSTTVTSSGTAQAGHTITYQWADISSGGTATIVSPTSQSTLINGLSVGTHTFQIKVTQDDGQTATATMTVTVTAPPTINAGASQTYAFGTTFTLAATFTTAPGTTGTFHWVNETDGTGTFSNQNGSTTTVSGLAAGTFRFGCTITQSDGQTAYSYVIITISAPLSSGTQLYITKGHKKRIFAP